MRTSRSPGADLLGTALLGTALLGYAALWAVGLELTQTSGQFWLFAAMTAGFAVLLLLARRTGRLRPGWLLASSAVLQLLGATRPPRTSDDVYRYAWDAKVQLAGIDPYRYVPSAPQLAHLRDRMLFGSGGPCAHPIPGGCTSINRPDVHTVYPPIAQLYFDLVRVLSFGRGGVLPFQLAAGVGAVLVTWLLLRWVVARGYPVWTVGLWAWCPLVVSDFGNNGHLDSWAVAAVVLALGAAGARAGLFAALGILLKLYPGLVLAPLLRQRPWRLLGAVLSLTMLAYLPHVLAVGTGVVGYLPGYLNEEGYDSGKRLLLLGAVLPHPFDTVAGVLVLAVAALWAAGWLPQRVAARLPAVDDPAQGAAALVGIAFLVATPAYGWYAAILLALAVCSRRYEWAALALAAETVYLVRAAFTHWWVVGSLIYAAGALAVALIWALRLRAPAAPVADRGRWSGSRTRS